MGEELGDEISKEPGEATLLLERMRAGDRDAGESLLPLLYAELRGLAAHALRKAGPQHTLQPTALVHEAYLRMVGPHDASGWNDRQHFVRVAARAMRCVLVDHARGRLTEKRGFGERPVPLEGLELPFEDRVGDVAAVGDALEQLSEADPELAQLVELRYFAGLSFLEVGQVMGISDQAARRRWRMARMALARLLEPEP